LVSTVRNNRYQKIIFDIGCLYRPAYRSTPTFFDQSKATKLLYTDCVFLLITSTILHSPPLSLRVSRFISLDPTFAFLSDTVEVVRVATARAHLHYGPMPGGGRNDAPRHAAATRLGSSSLWQAWLCGGGPWWTTHLLLFLHEAPPLRPGRPRRSDATLALAE
jgi:hypothetical protein